MKTQPIVINLNSLIDKVIIINNGIADTTELQKTVSDALLNVINAAQLPVKECNQEIPLSNNDTCGPPK